MTLATLLFLGAAIIGWRQHFSPLADRLLLLLAWYLGISLCCFLIYARDKHAARHGAWRTPENTLHTLALLGGWPGALLAQSWLRHKSSKASFRRLFWLTVVLNLLALLAFATPEGRVFVLSLLRSL